jgi:hypothetical protein
MLLGRVRAARFLIALLWVAMTAASCRGRATLPAAGDSRALRSVPVALCEDYPEESRSLETVRRDMQLLADAGVKALRVSIGWDGLEPERDKYDWAFWDSFVEIAAVEHGIRLLPYVAYTPRWSSTAPDASDFWRRPPADTKEFAEVMGLLASRYRGRIDSWEIWNEPDNRDYWTGTVGDYARLLEAGARAVHAAAPSARVVSGGLAGHTDFLAALFDGHPAATRATDVVNLHSYFETWNGGALEELTPYVHRVAAIIREHGGRQAIWMAEVGYSDHRRGAQVSPDYAARFAYEHTRPFQAVALVRTMALLFALPEVSLIAWYELKDPPDSDPVIGDANNRHLGVATPDYRPKPAQGALAFVNRLFAPGFEPLDARMWVVRPAGSASEVHAFRTRDQKTIVVAWLATNPKTARAGAATPPGSAGAAADGRHERLQLTVPGPPRAAAQVYDELGRPRERLSVEQHRAGEIHLPAVTLRGGEVAVIEIYSIS